MITVINPIVSEFDTQEQAVSHVQWFRAQVQKALDNTEPRLPHDQVMAEMRRLIQAKRERASRAGELEPGGTGIAVGNFGFHQ